ncbi:unnamed protein product [Lupinus luteus]|uniref:Secreted protein n=1 Tax=Lupinus luteus TaxID=3873 RepID=A0AAV1XT01_LUPLU
MVVVVVVAMMIAPVKVVWESDACARRHNIRGHSGAVSIMTSMCGVGEELSSGGGPMFPGDISQGWYIYVLVYKCVYKYVFFSFFLRILLIELDHKGFYQTCLHFVTNHEK